MMPPVETLLRVRYAETDQMGIVYYANYLVWMEVGRIEYCRAAGVSYRDMENQDGILLVVAEASCRYISPAHYDDQVIVRTWIADAHPRMMRFAYEMFETSSRRLLAAGETKHVFCDRDHKPVKLPQKYRAAFGIARLSHDREGAVPSVFRPTPSADQKP
jgi:acyl-CoA thioester hydrolase